MQYIICEPLFPAGSGAVTDDILDTAARRLHQLRRGVVQNSGLVQARKRLGLEELTTYYSRIVSIIRK